MKIGLRRQTTILGIVAVLTGCDTADSKGEQGSTPQHGATIGDPGDSGAGVAVGGDDGDDDDDDRANEGVGGGTGGYAPPGGSTSGSSGAGPSDSSNDSTIPDNETQGNGTSIGGTSGGSESGDDDGDSTSQGDSDASSSSSTGDEPTCEAVDPVVLYLSPDDSNSMSSPVQAREAIMGAFSSLNSVPIRTWEFLNYYNFPYPAADPGELAVFPSLVHDEDMADGEYMLQIGISSHLETDAERPPINITLVLDTSGSMNGLPIQMLQESCRAIVASLKDGDVVSMVSWDTSNNVIMAGHEVSGPDDPQLLEAIATLSASGGTDLHSGLTAGYGLAQQSYDPSRINRIVLVSDGGANAGETSIDVIAGHAGGNDQDGIYMVGVGVGDAGRYHDELMDSVTDAGKGASVFIASEDEAWKIFHQNFVNTLDVAARDVRVRVDLPPGFEIVKFSGEEYSADPTEIEPQHLAPNDAMVFNQKIATCAPDLLEDQTPLVITANYKDATTFETKQVTLETTFGDLLASDPTLLRKGAAIFEYAEALKTVQQGTPALEPAQTALARALELLPNDSDLLEIQMLLARL